MAPFNSPPPPESHQPAIHAHVKLDALEKKLEKLMKINEQAEENFNLSQKEITETANNNPEFQRRLNFDLLTMGGSRPRNVLDNDSAAVPEPNTIAVSLLAGGALAVYNMQKRKKEKKDSDQD